MSTWIDPVKQTAGPPLVSVGIPVFNGAAYLREALESLVRQDYAAVEYIISDNASTDETAAICRDFVVRDERIRYFRSDVNRGAAWNFDRVLSLAKGRYFMWAAHDDLWHPTFISRCVAVLEERHDVVVCHSRGQPFTKDGQPCGEPYSGMANEAGSVRDRWRRMMEHWELHAAIYGLIRRDVLARVRPVQSCLSADLVLMAELALHGAIIQLPDVLQWKRVPAPDESYRSVAEMLSYMGGRRKRMSYFHRFQTAAVCLRGARTSEISGLLWCRLVLDTIGVYMKRGYWLIDLKELLLTLAVSLGIKSPAWNALAGGAAGRSRGRS